MAEIIPFCDDDDNLFDDDVIEFDADELMQNYGEHKFGVNSIVGLWYRPEVEQDAARLAYVCLHIGYELGLRGTK